MELISQYFLPFFLAKSNIISVGSSPGGSKNSKGFVGPDVANVACKSNAGASINLNHY